MMRGHTAIFGEAAVPHLAEQAARPHAIDGVDHHAIAGLPPRHRAARLHDVAGEVHAHDARHGHLDPRHAPPREDVVVVQRGGAHLEDHVLGPRLRIGEVAHDLDRPGAAVLVDNRRSHAFVSICRRSRASRRRATRSTLPVLARGSSGMKTTWRGCWKAGALARAYCFTASSLRRRPSFVTTNAKGFSYLISSGIGTTQACWMSGCRSSSASTSPG